MVALPGKTLRSKVFSGLKFIACSHCLIAIAYSGSQESGQCDRYFTPMSNQELEIGLCGQHINSNLGKGHGFLPKRYCLDFLPNFKVLDYITVLPFPGCVKCFSYKSEHNTSEWKVNERWSRCGLPPDCTYNIYTNILSLKSIVPCFWTVPCLYQLILRYISLVGRVLFY